MDGLDSAAGVGVVGTVAVIGAWAAAQGFALAGATVLAAETPDEARAAWAHLPADVLVVVLTQAAAEALGEQAQGDGERLTVVMPA